VNFTSSSVSVCGLWSCDRGPWHSPSNAHAYRLLLVKEHPSDDGADRCRQRRRSMARLGPLVNGWATPPLEWPTCKRALHLDDGTSNATPLHCSTPG
jgi:hypothetical protein